MSEYFSTKAMMIGGRTNIGSGRTTRVNAVSISACGKANHQHILSSYYKF